MQSASKLAFALSIAALVAAPTHGNSGHTVEPATLTPRLASSCNSVPSDAKDTPKTVVDDETAKAMLVGKHMLSMQWVSWDRFGSATVEERNGVLYLKGNQEREGDYVRVDGVITKVEAKQFTFEGEIVTRVSFINHGDPCTRKGAFVFAVKGTRKYWRLQQMDNPCDEATDYVDVYFRS